jgi:hypothetical protein
MEQMALLIPMISSTCFTHVDPYEAKHFADSTYRKQIQVHNGQSTSSVSHATITGSN